MPREVVALVSADDYVAAVRVHADRVHDLLRRRGCGPAESVEVCEAYAFALLDALVNAPETVGDTAGWWFGRALELGRRLDDDPVEPEMSASVLAGTSGEGQVRAALGRLPQQERDAVMLRDAYDLPPQSVAVALGLDVDTAAAVVAVGRLHLVEAYDERPTPDLSSHTGRTPIDLGMLGRLADGSLPSPRMAPLRRHLGNCRGCEDAVELMAKGRRLCAGLPVVAMPDEAREAMLDRVTARAVAVLPTVEQVLLAIEEDEERRPAVSPIAVVLVIVLALVLGVAIAALTTAGSGDTHAFVDATPTAAAEQPSFSVSPQPSTSGSASPTATVTATAGSAATQTAAAVATPKHPKRTPTRSAKPVAAAAITVSPRQGRRGTAVTVSGTGWSPGAVVQISYSGALASSQASAQADQHGRFTATLQANGTLPGSYTITASDGSQTATATFRQTT
ncbi:MAG TPA: sigma factor-like helix-turn-helix DNA-binding protein [Mycobacteriales bacterium]|nr:sigma factor-like helix-turn-helix DNA-binding protein [Mycobacteriales bacterium]